MGLIDGVLEYVVREGSDCRGPENIIPHYIPYIDASPDGKPWIFSMCFLYDKDNLEFLEKESIGFDLSFIVENYIQSANKKQLKVLTKELERALMAVKNRQI